MKVMLFSLLLAASLTNWVPARWISNDPKSLDLLAGTPINCLLLEQSQWSEAFARQAYKQGIATLGVIRSESGAVDQARKLTVMQFSGVVLEGAHDPASANRVRAVLKDSRIPLVELTTRNRMRFDSDDPILGTDQGLWPGVRVEDKGAAETGPSAAPWINTNTGFLRFANAASDSAIWIANEPPTDSAVNITRYLQAIGDAAMTGAHWVVSLDAGFIKRLLARDTQALKDWKTIAQHLQYYEDHKEWRGLRPHSELAVVEDAQSGALLSGGVLDMIAVKHTPVLAVPYRRISPPVMQQAKMAVDVDPSALTPEQLAVLKAFTRAGGTLLSGPPGWKFQSLRPEAITLDKADLDKLDGIWKELNSMTGRKNMGARLFNVSSMLSNLLEGPGQKQLIMQLVNYSDFPAESITAHVLGTFHHARLYRPEAPVQELDTYPVDDGTGVDIDKIASVATIVIE